MEYPSKHHKRSSYIRITVVCLNIIMNQNMNEKVVLIGDYNLPNITQYNDNISVYSEYYVGTLGNYVNASEVLIEVFGSFELRQFNSDANANGVILDLLFSNSATDEILLPCDHHHLALFC